MLTTRTQDQIVIRLDARTDSDPLGFEINEYLPYLDFQHARKYLNEDVTEERWKQAQGTYVEPRQKMIDYMAFAFQKAHGQRGISANRSIQHMIAWGWLVSDEIGLEIQRLFDQEYDNYGLSILRKICDMLGIDRKEHGDADGRE